MSSDSAMHLRGLRDFAAEEPFRGELLGPERLNGLAREMASGWKVVTRPGSRMVLRRLRENARVLRTAREIAAATPGHPFPEADWLLDNFYVVEESLREVQTDMPSGYFRELPTLTSGEWAGQPRVLGLAVTILRHTESRLDEGQLRQFTNAFQSVSPLTIGELWAVPTMLRLALIENLRRLSVNLLVAIDDRTRATAWVVEAGQSRPTPPLPARPSDAYLVAWHTALRDRAGAEITDSVVDWRAAHAADMGEVLRREHRRQATSQVAVGNCVTSLRLLHAVDWAEFFEATSVVEAVLRAEPTGVYARQEFATRDRYRQAVERLAKAAKRPEAEVARRAVERAGAGNDPRTAHVGYYLTGPGRPGFERELGCRFSILSRLKAVPLDYPHATYFGLLALFTLVGTALAAAGVWAAGVSGWLAFVAAVLGILPASEVAVALVAFVVGRLVPPRVLPKLDFRRGIPAEFRTVVVIPGMLTRAESTAQLVERLELHHLANPDPELRFALLTDWADADAAERPGDDDLVQDALARVRDLNRRYAPGGSDRFFLFHRGRAYNPAEGVWMGWERKRGKLHEFNRLLLGAADTGFVVRSGEITGFGPRFVLTLDADTVLPKDAAPRLIATLAHPLNRPQLSPDGRRVVAGYGVLQPRVSFLFGTGLRSRFARTFAGSSGIDPYSAAASDVYQDLFGEGTFTGKGLYDLAAFAATAGAAFPDNAVLSHDLIESTFARCGLVTDIELFDDFPAKYNVYAKREHRWIRGDWQLLPWLGRRVPRPAGPRDNPLSLLSRWKLSDNLRRTLVPPALVVVLVLGSVCAPGAGWVGSAAVLAVLASPLVLQALSTALVLIRDPRSANRDTARGLVTTAGQVGLAAVFLANQAAVAVDAIARTLYRLFVSRKHLLEWETAASAEARLGSGLRQFAAGMVPAVGQGIGLAAATAMWNPAALLAALPWVAAWVLSPVVAWWVSRPTTGRSETLTPQVETDLRRVARKTWRFFETFVTPEDNWLPPDNFQEDPKGVVAHRTSPTNAGLLLLSTLSAHDLGYVTLPEIVDRFGRTFDTLDRMETHRGHFLNWYETTSLRVLPPAYVSTVDSGNLLGCLLAARNGLTEKANEVIPAPTAIAGIRDALNLVGESKPTGAAGALRAHLETVPADLPGWERWLGTAAELATAIPVDGPARLPWIDAVRSQIGERQAELRSICPWVGELARAFVTAEDRDELWAGLLGELTVPRSVNDWAARLPTTRQSLLTRSKADPDPARAALAERLAEAVEKSTAGRLADGLADLSRRAGGFADAMDFGFLYNHDRQLFSIGYNVPAARLDPAHYDLIASESAITSFLAVARGVVPRKHWFQLGRLTTRTAGRPGLISWGGTMFEYLMPRLLLPPYPGTMLDAAQRAAVGRQIEFGRQSGVPWGVSESGFYVVDAAQDYQYQSFGVPGLGLKRGLAQDLVIAPYATMLAVSVDARAAVANFVALRGKGGEGPFGFYEAIDFTPERLAPGKRFAVVKSYMAHHQGMGLCAIANRLTGDAHCRRLRAEPAVRAVELLLQERVPPASTQITTADADEAIDPGLGKDPAVSRRLHRADTPAPRTHLLSNGHYTVMVTNAGGGFSTCRGMAVTRWRTDPTRDDSGSFIYIRDTASGHLWSAAHHPVGGRAERYEVTFSVDKAEFCRRDGDMETRLDVTVAPDRDVEVRRVTLTNHGSEVREFEVTSYAEVALCDQRADLAHPAFGKLFLETEYYPKWDALVCRRRPRSPDQPPVFAAHTVASTPGSDTGPTQFESDRGRFLGRRRSPATAEALTRPLSGTVGPVLDPVFALRKSVRVAPGSSVTVAFATAVADDLGAAEALADLYRGLSGAERAFELAWANSRVELHDLGITVAESHLFQRLAGHVLFPNPALRSGAALMANTQGQPGLWKFGISGDMPIVVVVLTDHRGLSLARDVLKAHSFWRGRGFVVDVVLITDLPGSYREELYQDLCGHVRGSDCRELADKSGGVFVRKASQFGPDDRSLLLAVARVTLYGDRGTLADQIDALGRGRVLPPPLRADPLNPPLPTLDTDRPPPDGLLFFNGTGGFSPDGREYVIVGTSPAPWANVIANPLAGCITTDSGLGYTWVGNSQANRLTPWSNDPVSDPPAEAVYLMDDETGLVWTPTPLPAGAHWPVAVRHGSGYTVYSQDQGDWSVELTVFVPVADPVKLVSLKVTNRAGRSRQLSAAFAVDWVLGTTREQSAAHVITRLDPAGVLLAWNRYSPEFGGAVAFLGSSLTGATVTGDRDEFIGRNGSPTDPAGMRRSALSGHTGPALDPCGAVLGSVSVPSGGDAQVVFSLGQCDSADAASALAEKYRTPAACAAAFQEVTAAWDRRLSAVTVRTPDPAFDILVNRWLPYQVLSCRVWGRSAVYQSGGAFGFRDQLQDVLALVYAEPPVARAHILRAAGRQFMEGDVQHWWHPPGDRGVRTRFSDDYLWLPFVAARYAAVTGDTDIFDERVHYIRGPQLGPDQHESYFLPEVTAEAEPLYAHCLRAFDRGMALGPHGQPLIGGGDWNDGMNLVGVGGRGESVWVAWFQIAARRDFARVAEARGDTQAAGKLREQADKLRAATEAHAWDGGWYLRAWFDDGTPLGTATGDECRIDSLPQSWAVLSGAGDPGRAAQAVDAAVSHLVDADARLVRLFTPPFDTGRLQPGYIKGYLPGIRENGGQYTHAAIWLVQALAALGRGDQAFALWDQICPVGAAADPVGVDRYKVEPYVVAADVYGMTPHVGRGGWTWYTGSAAWLYRAAVESLLGLTVRGQELSFAPSLPANWPGFELDYRHGETTYRCRVEWSKDGNSRAEVWVDGEQIVGQIVPLKHDGQVHEVRIRVGPGAPLHTDAAARDLLLNETVRAQPHEDPT